MVERSVHDAFLDKLLKLARTAWIGDPMDTDTQVGPVTTEQQLEKVLGYIDVAKGEGAATLMGGSRPNRPELGNGWFVEPTIFGGVCNDMRIAQEEVFGPVLSVIPLDSADQAPSIANDNSYGHAAGVWSQNFRKIKHFSERLQTGTICGNTHRVISDMTPLGGYKNSGLGRENGQNAIFQYLQTMTVMLSTASEVANTFIMR